VVDAPLTHYAGNKMKKPKNRSKEGSKKENRSDKLQMAKSTLMGKCC
jgi:hypothetical protein